MKTKLESALEVLREELRKDQAEGSYYHSWKANIAMAFVDNMDWYLENNNPNFKDEVQTEVNIPEVANEAAEYFLQNLIK